MSVYTRYDIIIIKAHYTFYFLFFLGYIIFFIHIWWYEKKVNTQRRWDIRHSKARQRRQEKGKKEMKEERMKSDGDDEEELGEPCAFIFIAIKNVFL